MSEVPLKMVLTLHLLGGISRAFHNAISSPMGIDLRSRNVDETRPCETEVDGVYTSPCRRGGAGLLSRRCRDPTPPQRYTSWTVFLAPSATRSPATFAS